MSSGGSGGFFGAGFTTGGFDTGFATVLLDVSGFHRPPERDGLLAHPAPTSDTAINKSKHRYTCFLNGAQKQVICYSYCFTRMPAPAENPRLQVWEPAIHAESTFVHNFVS